MNNYKDDKPKINLPDDDLYDPNSKGITRRNWDQWKKQQREQQQTTVYKPLTQAEAFPPDEPKEQVGIKEASYVQPTPEGKLKRVKLEPHPQLYATGNFELIVKRVLGERTGDRCTLHIVFYVLSGEWKDYKVHRFYQLDGTDMDPRLSRPLKEALYNITHKIPRDSDYFHGPPLNTLYVTGFAPEVTDKALRDRFEMIGKVKAITRKGNPPYVFVEMEIVRHAIRAIKMAITTGIRLEGNKKKLMVKPKYPWVERFEQVFLGRGVKAKVRVHGNGKPAKRSKTIEPKVGEIYGRLY